MMHLNNFVEFKTKEDKSATDTGLFPFKTCVFDLLFLKNRVLLLIIIRLVYFTDYFTRCGVI